MRPVLASLLLVALGCSKAAGPFVDSPTASIPPVPSTVPSTLPLLRDAGTAPPPVHVVRLPDQPYDDLFPPFRSIDIALGDPPGPRFPAGTVYIASSDMKTVGPVSVTEWDLARAEIVASVPLPISTDEGSPWILRVGDRLRVLVSGREGVSYVQLTKDLRIERSERWAGYVDMPGIAAFSADARLTAVAYSGDAATIAREKYGVILTTFDASGRRVASRIVQRLRTDDSDVDEGIQGNAVVVDGRVFVVLVRFKTGNELLRFSPDLRVEKRVLLSRKADYTVGLHASEGRLQVVTGYPERHAIAFSTSLETLGPTAVPEDFPDMKLGDEEVALCGEAGVSWLAWTTGSENPCAASRESMPLPKRDKEPF